MFKNIIQYFMLILVCLTMPISGFAVTRAIFIGVKDVTGANQSIEDKTYEYMEGMKKFQDTKKVFFEPIFLFRDKDFRPDWNQIQVELGEINTKGSNKDSLFVYYAGISKINEKKEKLLSFDDTHDSLPTSYISESDFLAKIYEKTKKFKNIFVVLDTCHYSHQKDQGECSLPVIPESDKFLIMRTTNRYARPYFLKWFQTNILQNNIEYNPKTIYNKFESNLTNKKDDNIINTVDENSCFFPNIGTDECSLIIFKRPNLNISIEDMPADEINLTLHLNGLNGSSFEKEIEIVSGYQKMIIELPVNLIGKNISYIVKIGDCRNAESTTCTPDKYTENKKTMGITYCINDLTINKDLISGQFALDPLNSNDDESRIFIPPPPKPEDKEEETPTQPGVSPQTKKKKGVSKKKPSPEDPKTIACQLKVKAIVNLPLVISSPAINSPQIELDQEKIARQVAVLKTDGTYIQGIDMVSRELLWGPIDLGENIKEIYDNKKSGWICVLSGDNNHIKIISKKNGKINTSFTHDNISRASFNYYAESAPESGKLLELYAFFRSQNTVHVRYVNTGSRQGDNPCNRSLQGVSETIQERNEYVQTAVKKWKNHLFFIVPVKRGIRVFKLDMNQKTWQRTDKKNWESDISDQSNLKLVVSEKSDQLFLFVPMEKSLRILSISKISGTISRNPLQLDLDGKLITKMTETIGNSDIVITLASQETQGLTLHQIKYDFVQDHIFSPRSYRIDNVGFSSSAKVFCAADEKDTYVLTENAGYPINFLWDDKEIGTLERFKENKFYNSLEKYITHNDFGDKVIFFVAKYFSPATRTTGYDIVQKKGEKNFFATSDLRIKKPEIISGDDIRIMKKGVLVTTNKKNHFMINGQELQKLYQMPEPENYFTIDSGKIKGHGEIFEYCSFKPDKDNIVRFLHNQLEKRIYLTSEKNYIYCLEFNGNEFSINREWIVWDKTKNIALTGSWRLKVPDLKPEIKPSVMKFNDSVTYVFAAGSGDSSDFLYAIKAGDELTQTNIAYEKQVNGKIIGIYTVGKKIAVVTSDGHYYTVCNANGSFTCTPKTAMGLSYERISCDDGNKSLCFITPERRLRCIEFME
jgi:hypothetical protein